MENATQFADIISNVQNVASDAFTFEAWVRTTDFCHRGEVTRLI